MFPESYCEHKLCERTVLQFPFNQKNNVVFLQRLHLIALGERVLLGKGIEA